MKVLVFGTFDDLHPGHCFVLQSAAKRGDLHVIVAKDSTVQQVKGHLPKQPEQERMAAIQQQFPQAVVLLGHETDYLEPVRKVQPDLILLGYDQRMPPGISEKDLPCNIERLPAFEPQKYKSSLLNE